MSILRTFSLAVLGLAASLGLAQAATVGSINSAAVSTSTRPANIIESDFFNNFFTFDLAGLSGTVTGATLSIFANGRYQTTLDQVTYTVYDASSDPATTQGATAFADLGSGTVYGSTTILTPGASGAMPRVDIELSGALADLTAGLGGIFHLGGTSDLPRGNSFLWLSSNNPEPVAQLSLSFAPAPIPLPAGLPLLLAGFGALALAARRRAART